MIFAAYPQGILLSCSALGGTNAAFIESFEIAHYPPSKVVDFVWLVSQLV